MDEFGLIRRFFASGFPERPDVALGVGDDAALLHAPPGEELVVTVDSLVAGVHFPEDLAPEAVGHRALAVSLSDLAAMGAAPAWALLALTLPAADEAWVAGFARGFSRLAARYRVGLVGGNLTRGALNAGVTLLGFVPAGQALTRRGARAGDEVWVTGSLGAAAAGLRSLQTGTETEEDDECLRRFCFPEPRVAAGLALRGVASAAIDVSDGFSADLGHILQASGVGARLDVAALPLPPALLRTAGRSQAERLALGGGDDYELCFTLPPARRELLAARAADFGCAVTRVGEITAEPGLRCRGADGLERSMAAEGYRHF